MSSKLIIFSALIAVALAIKPFNGYNEPLPNGLDIRIIGGSEATPGQYPWQVSLQWGVLNSVSHFCGGSIINSEWIVTAGHCADAIPSYGTFVVKAGKHNLKKIENGEQTVKVAKAIIHKGYTGGVGPCDIALLKLEQPLTLNNQVKPISLPKAGSDPTGNATLTGWGTTATTGTPDKLQKVELPIIDLVTCKSSIEDLTGSAPVYPSNVCTGPLTGGYSACNGDSGGPLILNNGGNPELIGIVSWGIVPCGIKGAPSVYTRMSSYIDWVQDVMAKN